jgi:hypothetical protein
MCRSVTRLDLPSRIYIIEVMIEIDLEPEVEACKPLKASTNCGLRSTALPGGSPSGNLVAS